MVWPKDWNIGLGLKSKIMKTINIGQKLVQIQISNLPTSKTSFDRSTGRRKSINWFPVYTYWISYRIKYWYIWFVALVVACIESQMWGLKFDSWWPERGNKKRMIFAKTEQFYFFLFLHHFPLRQIFYEALLWIFEFCFDKKSICVFIPASGANVHLF
jgi:hypothetical protein